MTTFGRGGWPHGFYRSRKLEVPSCKSIRITMPWAMRSSGQFGAKIAQKSASRKTRCSNGAVV